MWQLAAVGTLTLWLAGCWRDAPPEIQEFRAPATHVEEETPESQPTTQPAPAVVEEPKPEEPAEEKPKTVKAPTTVEAAPEPPQEAPKKEPTIIGSWRLTQAAHNGQVMPLPAGMEMTMTFNDDGTLAMSQSFQGQSHDRTGTYTLNGNQITISMMGQTKTGNYSLNGDNELTMDMDNGQATFTRN